MKNLMFTRAIPSLIIPVVLICTALYKADSLNELYPQHKKALEILHFALFSFSFALIQGIILLTIILFNQEKKEKN